jgi:hypothetical protein
MDGKSTGLLTRPTPPAGQGSGRLWIDFQKIFLRLFLQNGSTINSRHETRMKR